MAPTVRGALPFGSGDVAVRRVPKAYGGLTVIGVPAALGSLVCNDACSALRRRSQKNTRIPATTRPTMSTLAPPDVVPSSTSS